MKHKKFLAQLKHKPKDQPGGFHLRSKLALKRVGIEAFVCINILKPFDDPSAFRLVAALSSQIRVTFRHTF